MTVIGEWLSRQSREPHGDGGVELEMSYFLAWVVNDRHVMELLLNGRFGPCHLAYMLRNVTMSLCAPEGWNSAVASITL